MARSLRILTAEEIEFVSGGTYIPGYGWVIQPDGGGGGGYYGGGGGNSGGYYGGSASSDPNPISPTNDCAASNAAKDIYEHADSRDFEYQTIIYRGPDGQIHRTEERTTHQPTTVGAASWEVWGIPSGSTIIGVVHNHPTHTIQNPNDPNSPSYPVPEWSRESQSMPSWWDMQRMKESAEMQRDQNIAGWQDYTSYIAFDGKVKEFKYSDQDWSKHPTVNSGQSHSAIESEYTPCS